MLKNRKQRMEFLQNNDNWKVQHRQELITTLSLDWGEHQFIRIIGYMMDRFYREPQNSWIGQFEVVFDKNDYYFDYYLESRSNSEICDIMSKEKPNAEAQEQD